MAVRAARGCDGWVAVSLLAADSAAAARSSSSLHVSRSTVIQAATM